MKTMAENVLYYGDNLEILRLYIKDESVDLVYLDPPFKSNQDYNVLFAEHNGTRSAAQIKAFEDTWEWNNTAAKEYQSIVEGGHHRVSQAMQAFRTFLGESDMMAYLAMMAPRLVELHRVLKSTGSIYLHCDPTASHYLKMLMDAVFEPANFQNEIVWHYRRWTGEANRFQRMHDTILFYAKNRGKVCFDPLYTPYTKKSAKRKQHYHTRIKGDDVYVTSVDPRGVRENDVWDISIINPAAKERLGYPTQKPETLLERIIQASSNEGDIVLDPFCGCGTTIAVAQKLGRQWIGIDITHLAVALIKHRLKDMFDEQVKYEVIGEPKDLAGAKALAKEDPYQFQWWALGLVGARPVEQKKGADKGIDGRLYFHDEAEGGKTKQIMLSVKSGNIEVRDVRDLRGVVEREDAQIGVLICMEKPTRNMRREAASAGFYKSHWGTHPKLQILTIEELLTGHKIDYPDITGVNVTFRRAQKAKAKQEPHPELDYPEQ
jgi:site-specific DNA-methyltransferase (adenine-specific)